MNRPIIRICLILVIILAGCNFPARSQTEATLVPPVNTVPVPVSTQVAPTAPPSEPVDSDPLRVWLDTPVSPSLRAAIRWPEDLQEAATVDEAQLLLHVTPPENARLTWVYALVAPFPTVVDGVTSIDLKTAWKGGRGGQFALNPLRMSESTRAAVEAIWGPPGEGVVITLPDDALLEEAWASRPSWAIVPFDRLEPRWKVLTLDGLTPLDKDLDLSRYPLVVPFGVSGEPDALSALEAVDPSWLPSGNRDIEKMTVLLMTGVTALVRATGSVMEKRGTTFPAQDTLPWFEDADLVHISNEIAFSPHCPPANPYQDTLQFCSRPEYIELLEYIGTDIVELTGNHMLDWNADNFEYTLQMYEDRDWKYYAAGRDLEQARAALTFEDHGNKLAFIGCNPAGPPHAWATELTPGIANCDYAWMHAEIERVRAEGYLPIATFQYHEYYTPEARPWQVEDFTGMAAAGAVIVSGSQAHKPQVMQFFGDSFVHYGLGNLFFDQMDIPVVGTRQEFLDRHVFYDGRYLSTTFYTAMLEDYARPRPMSQAERRDLIEFIFTESGW